MDKAEIYIKQEGFNLFNRFVWNEWLSSKTRSRGYPLLYAHHQYARMDLENFE